MRVEKKGMLQEMEYTGIVTVEEMIGGLKTARSIHFFISGGKGHPFRSQTSRSQKVFSVEERQNELSISRFTGNVVFSLRNIRVVKGGLIRGGESFYHILYNDDSEAMLAFNT